MLEEAEVTSVTSEKELDWGWVGSLSWDDRETHYGLDSETHTVIEHQ